MSKGKLICDYCKIIFNGNVQNMYYVGNKVIPLCKKCFANCVKDVGGQK